MKPIEPDTHITAPPPCARESPSRRKDVASQLLPNSRTTEHAQQALPDCETDRNTHSQIVSLGAIETTGTDSHGLVRLKESALSSILDQEGDLESSLLPTFLCLLGRLQDKFNLKHRFPLFVEFLGKGI